MDLRRLVIYMFVMLFSSQAYAQHEELLDKTWYLYKLEIDEEEYEYHSLEIQAGNESRIDFSKDDDSILFDGCPGWGMFLDLEFIENENKFILGGFGGLTLEYCYNWDYDEYMLIEDYFYPFYHNYGSIIEYSFETIDAIEFLIFTGENNDKLYYTAENLSTPDFDELGFSIYPNPTQDWLHIHLEELSNNTYLEVYDIHGKLLKNLMLSELETHLDVSEYVSGLYFIKMTDNLGNAQIGKFIKQ